MISRSSLKKIKHNIKIGLNIKDNDEIQSIAILVMTVFNDYKFLHKSIISEYISIIYFFSQGIFLAIVGSKLWIACFLIFVYSIYSARYSFRLLKKAQLLLKLLYFDYLNILKTLDFIEPELKNTSTFKNFL